MDLAMPPTASRPGLPFVFPPRPDYPAYQPHVPNRLYQRRMRIVVRRRDQQRSPFLGPPRIFDGVLPVPQVQARHVNLALLELGGIVVGQVGDVRAPCGDDRLHRVPADSKGLETFRRKPSQSRAVDDHRRRVDVLGDVEGSFSAGGESHVIRKRDGDETPFPKPLLHHVIGVPAVVVYERRTGEGSEPVGPPFGTAPAGFLPAGMAPPISGKSSKVPPGNPKLAAIFRFGLSEAFIGLSALGSSLGWSRVGPGKRTCCRKK